MKLWLTVSICSLKRHGAGGGGEWHWGEKPAYDTVGFGYQVSVPDFDVPCIQWQDTLAKKQRDQLINVTQTTEVYYLLYSHSLRSCAVKSWIFSMILWSCSMCQAHQRLHLVCDKLLLSCTGQRENIYSAPSTNKENYYEGKEWQKRRKERWHLQRISQSISTIKNSFFPYISPDILQQC